MKFNFRKMQQGSALIIANNWKYEEPYSFYDMTADIDDYNEIIDESLRNKSNYFEAYANDELVGFFTLSKEDDEMEIGLGLKPELCGRGIGKEFLGAILDYIDEKYSYGTLCMSVASFNERAIKVYQAFGFTKQGTFVQETNGGEYEFIKLVKGR